MSTASMKVIAYADGACLGNPGPGGWGVVIMPPDAGPQELSGASPSTTNNRMEITAAIEALLAIEPGSHVELHTDSQYVVMTMTAGWKRNRNGDLWRQLDDAVRMHARVDFKWVRGHFGNPGNERADELARSAARREKPGARPLFTNHKNSQRIREELHLLLDPDETVADCAGCGRLFVAHIRDGEPVDRYCTLAGCQLKARTESRSGSSKL